MKVNCLLAVILIISSYAQVAFAGMWSEIAKDISKNVIKDVTKRVITNIIVDAITQPSSASGKEMPSSVQSSANDNDRIKNIARRHFRSESQCDINGIMPFYNDIVYYEN